MPEPLSPERFCCRCGGSQGWRDDQPNFCAVCWDSRLPVPRVLLAALDAERAKTERLRDGIGEYLLWRPAERGHAAAHNKLAALASGEADTDET